MHNSGNILESIELNSHFKLVNHLVGELYINNALCIKHKTFGNKKIKYFFILPQSFTNPILL